MIYIHVPFCRSFCTYCGFYSERLCSESGHLPIDSYISSLCAEILRRREEILAAAACNTLYIGGGTPSLLPLAALEQILKALPLSGFDEFTIEVNPDDILKGGLSYSLGLKALGVNRVSMGVQSFSDSELHWMGRRHNASQAVQAFRLLRDAGFENISLDLIFGQGSTENLSSGIDSLLALSPEHVSAYQLSVESGSALESMLEKGLVHLPDDSVCAAQYALLCERLSAAGYEHYEISNWAKPGFRARHNSAYWTRCSYVGLGPGAHSFSREREYRSWNSETLPSWQSEGEQLSAREVREERTMLGLRCCEGIDAAALPQDRLAAELASGRLCSCSSHRVRIPETHWFVSDDIISNLL